MDSEKTIGRQNSPSLLKSEKIFQNNATEPHENYYYRLFENGTKETIDFDVTLDDRPEWLDEERFKRGQRFAIKHLPCLLWAEMISTMMIFSVETVIKVFIFTGRSSTILTALRRYNSAFVRMFTWFTDDIWSQKKVPGRTNLSTVRAMHKDAYTKMTSDLKDHPEKKFTLAESKAGLIPDCCPMFMALKSDLRSINLTHVPDPSFFVDQNTVWLNQRDMAMTHWGFFGMAVTFPKKFGLHHVTDEDLEDFIHMWRGLGFLLGIKDEYNFGNTNLAGVRERTNMLIDRVVKPSFRNLSADWDHMCKCFVESLDSVIPLFRFRAILMFMCDLLDVGAHQFKRAISYWDYALFVIYKVILSSLLKIPGMLFCVSKITIWILNKIENEVAKM